MPTYGKVAVNFLRHDVSGTATDLAVADIAKKDGETFTGTMNAYDLIVGNNLTVNGTQTILNTETLQVEDKEIDLGKVSSPSNASASGGGIKLLGGSDGDKTITWLSSNNAWNFSENINIAAGKKLGVGGSNYGTSGQVLTSGGASAAPSWTTPSAGSEISLTAKGTLPNGCPVVINAAGKAEKAGIATPEWQTVQSPVANLSDAVWVSVDNIAANLIAVTYVENSQLKAVAGYVSGGVITFYTPASAGSNYANVSEVRTCLTHTSWGRRVGVCVRNSGYAKATNYEVGQSAPYNIQWQGGGDLTGTTNSGNPCICDANQTNQVFVGWLDNTTGQIKCRGMKINGSSVSFTNTLTAVNNARQPSLSSALGGTQARMLLTYTVGGNLKARTIDAVSSGTPSAGSEKALYNGSVGESSGAMMNLVRSESAKYTQAGSGTCVHAVVFHDTVYTYARLVKTDTGSSLSTFDNDTNHQVSGANLAWLSCCFDGNSDGEKLWVAYQDTGDSNKIMAKSADWNGTTLGSFSSSETIESGSASYNQLSPTNLGQPGGSVVIAYGMTSGSDRLKSRYLKGAVSNVAHNKVIGFSNGAYTDGQTATINIMGNTIGNQSSLTPGTYYYVQQDGTLDTTKELDVTAGGVALSSTELLIVFGKGNY